MKPTQISTEKTFRDMVESSGISQKKIAERLGVTSTTVRNWMHPGAQVPTLVMEWIEKIDSAVNEKIH